MFGLHSERYIFFTYNVKRGIKSNDLLHSRMTGKKSYREERMSKNDLYIFEEKTFEYKLMKFDPALLSLVWTRSGRREEKKLHF